MRSLIRCTLALLLLGLGVLPSHADGTKDDAGTTAPGAATSTDAAKPGATAPGSGAEGGGTTGPAGVSVPRVMVEGFSAEPAVVPAGADFQVTFTLRNTSTTTRVQNLKVTVSSPDAAFLPSTGTSSLFIDRIRAERSVSRTVGFTALPSLEAKPYLMTVALEYEDAQANAYSSTETVAVQVAQELRAAASAPQLTPQQLNVGQEGSLTLSVQNQGKTKLYNAKASIPEGQALTAPDFFVGTVEPGASGAVDMTVAVASEASGPVDVLISYEDVTGKPFTLTEQVMVTAAAPPVVDDEMIVEEPEPAATFPVATVVIAGIAAIAAAVVIVMLVRRSRRRKAQQADEASLAMMDGQPLVTEDWQ